MADPEELQRMAQLVELNRQRLEQVLDQISRLETVQNEHVDTEAALRALAKLHEDTTGPSNSMIPIGAGVQIPISNTGDGLAVVDIGSGLYAEKPFPEAAEMMAKRIADLGLLVNELSKEAANLEHRIGELAKTFNSAATQTLPDNDPTNPPPILDSDSQTTDEPPAKPTRRRGFGGELTLDD